MFSRYVKIDAPIILNKKKGGSQQQPSAVGCFEKCEAAIFGKPTKNHHGINISDEQ